MSPTDLSPSAVADLTDKELEILRLLAAGHTVKSIAADLGRSEASINERLRDARRKTGAGSSRELARWLDAQKIWDRNIDLSIQHPSAKASAPPSRMGRTWSKGTIAMIIALPASAFGLMLAVPNPAPQAPQQQTAPATTDQQTPLVGQWSLDISRIPADERPRQVTISFNLSDDRKWSAVIEIVSPDGTIRRAESIAAADGQPVPVSGNMEFIDTVSLRQPAPNTLVMTLGKGGIPVATRVYTVTKDRQSMTETIVWAGSAMPQLETTHFRRVG